MVKKILFPFIAIFLAYRSYELLKTLWFLEPDALHWSVKIISAILINLFITGVFAFVGFAYKTNRLLTERYYHVKNPKTLNKFAKLLNIELFKKFLLVLIWGKDKYRKRYFDGTQHGLENLDFQTRQSEFGHLGAFICILVAIIPLILQKHYFITIVTVLLNVIVNLYPVILQRVHRIKIKRIRSIQFKIESSPI